MLHCSTDPHKPVTSIHFQWEMFFSKYWLSSPVPVSSCLSCSAQRGWTWSQPFCSEGRPLLTPSSASNLTGLSIHQVRPMAGMSPQGGNTHGRISTVFSAQRPNMTASFGLDCTVGTVLHSKTSLKGRSSFDRWGLNTEFQMSLVITCSFKRIWSIRLHRHHCSACCDWLLEC